ncbi:gliding motility-associated C-terminal domain-containing protein [Galbibacter sp. BG1]|uniref:gliding motility-associated C-terminal domain-containing protein n=1 Tax=Galbibacter sp. BG1 TaxID=1170699 RepID=UPI0015BFBF45|nr:gliding motility-associated C-terminal domain-containing protein [Galbibacter sp. BG1]QLE00572.1 gliding motility-associated C-terminal domain-containing protein [Galbibacter sp. BG1]
MNKTTLSFAVIKTVFFLSILLCTNSLSAQCPTVTNTTQDFCDIDGPRVEDLVATNNGGGIAWFIAATGGNPISPTTPLANNETYYADNSTGNCGARTAVTVNIFGRRPTGVDVRVDKCSSDNSTVADLEADGVNIEWYDARTGGNLLPPSTPLTDGSTYWVQQTENGCTSRRSPTTIQIIDPGAPTGDPIQFFCIDPDGQTVFTVNDLSANGTEIKWYNSQNGTVPLDPTTPLIEGEDYFATQSDFPCESEDRYRTVVEFDDAVDAGENGTLAICDDETASFNLFNFLQGTPDNGGTWSGPQPTANGDQGTLDTSLLSDGSYNFTYTVLGQNACPDETAIVTVNVQALPDAGGDGTAMVCSSDPPVNLITFLGGTPDGGGTWSPALASGTGVFDPSVDTPGIYTYTVDPTAPCTIPDTAQVTITVEEAPFAGNNGTAIICENETPIDLFSFLGGTPDAGGTWSPALASGTGVFDPNVDLAGNYTYTVPSTAICPEDTAIVNVTIEEPPYAGMDGTAEVCSNDPSIDLFSLLSDNPDTGGTWSPSLASGTGIFNPSIDPAGTYTYTVMGVDMCADDTAQVIINVEQAPDAGQDASTIFCLNDSPIDLFTILGGTPETGGTWSPALSSGTGIFNPAVDPAGAYTYTLPATALCDESSAVVTVTLETPPNAGTDGIAELCTNDTAVDLITFLGNNPDTGGTWMPALASGTGIFDPAVDTSNTYTYTVLGANACSQDSSTVQVTVDTAPNAGNNNTVSYCGDDPAINLFDLLGPNAETGGTWSGPSNLENADSGTFNPAINTSGDYIYTVAGNGACKDATALVSVTVINPQPTLNANGNIFCAVDARTITELLENINPDLGGTLTAYDAATGGTPYDLGTLLIDNTTYYISETDVTSGCETTNRLEVTVVVEDPADPMFSTTEVDFCLIAQPIVENLSSFVTNASSLVWFDAPDSNTPIANDDPLTTMTYFAASQGANGCLSANRIALNVIVTDNPAPDIEEDGNLFCGVTNPTLEDLENNLIYDSSLSILWFDAPVNGNELPTTTLLENGQTYYAATFNEEKGCESFDRLEITVDLTACDGDQFPLFIPDGFSPNADGINDTFELVNVQFIYPDYTIEIYNRYGNIVFKGSDNLFWDGTSNQSRTIGDKVVPNGVYFYIINFNRDNRKPHQGKLYLNR